uniref:Ribonuclease P n=1 Tax=Strongyloides papillosus TaxID=174720 RepID=A0A0N5BY64_STREA
MSQEKKNVEVLKRKESGIIERIISKTKVKGLNYKLINSERQLIEDKNKLIIGIGFKHTRSGPSDTLLVNTGDVGIRRDAEMKRRG